MKVVKETKRASVKQMENMAFNLRQRTEIHTCVSMEADSYYSGNNSVEYRIYAHEKSHSAKSWQGLLDLYKKLISA